MEFTEIFKQNLDSISVIEDYKYYMIIGRKNNKYRIVVKEGDEIKYNATLIKDERFVKNAVSCYLYYKSMGIRVKILNNVTNIFEERNDELSGIKDYPRRITF